MRRLSVTVYPDKLMNCIYQNVNEAVYYVLGESVFRKGNWGCLHEKDSGYNDPDIEGKIVETIYGKYKIWETK